MSQSPFSDAGPNPYQSPSPLGPAPDVNPAGRAEVAPGVIALLLATRPWVRFLSIIGFIVAALIVLAALAIGAMGAGGGGAPMIGAGVVYIAMAALYGVGAMILGRYASRITDLEYARSNVALEEALAAQKSFWKFTGILMVAVISIYAVILVIAFAVGLIGALR
jgi:hypothetical protein